MGNQEQKTVKILGLSINQNLGVLEATNLKFNEKNNLIAVHGEVGSGKTTLQRAVALGTKGSETLKDDKTIYGNIDIEVQLLDGEKNVFVGCKSAKSGKLEYILYIKDKDGKRVENPVIDGVEATPAKYLKLLQTKLTWRLDELISENPTVQKRILLEIYKPELAKLGIVFDKKSDNYEGSILHQIEEAEERRTTADFHRKHKGGFAKHLLSIGVNVENESSVPKRIDTSESETKRNKLKYDIDNFSTDFEEKKKNKEEALKNKGGEIVLKLKENNTSLINENELLRSNYKKKEDLAKDRNIDLDELMKNATIFWRKYAVNMEETIQVFERLKINAIKPFNESTLSKELDFDEFGNIASKPDDEIFSVVINARLRDLARLRGEIVTLKAEKIEGGTEKLDLELSEVKNKIKIAEDNNLVCDACDAFFEWQVENNEVLELKTKYSRMLAEVKTGVDGLQITADQNDNIYLEYNGVYDPAYFGNEANEFRKLSSYSDTQKPVICLLVQSVLLNKMAKSMRYLWIDRVPIDKKTKSLLEKMGQDLGVTIFLNITGDFSKNDLKDGEILIENGHLFF